MTALLSILVSIIGVIIYFAVKNNADLKEVGRIMFAFGLLVALFQLGAQVVGVLR